MTKHFYTLLFLSLTIGWKGYSQNVGVGTSTPNSRLEIQGLSGDENSVGILRLSNTSGATHLRFGTVEGSRSWIQSYGSLPLHINRLGNNVVFNETAGNVGIGVASPAQKLHLSGNFRMDGVAVEGNSSYRVYRNLAAYNNTSAAAPGAFVIVTSQPWNSACMFRVKLEGYFYDATSTFEMNIGGYMYINNDFYNYGYTSTGSQSLTVRLGRNIATNTIAIIIGSEAGSYSYPKITVTSFMQGHSGINENYAGSWTISQLTNLSGVIDYIVTVPDVTRLNGLSAGDFIRNQFASAQTASFWINGMGRIPTLDINNVNTRLTQGSGNALRLTTNSGYLELGPQNTSWAHVTTDRPRYYFNKGISVDEGLIGSYDEDLNLQTSGTTRVTILNSNGNVGIGTASPSYRLDVQGGSLRVGTLYGSHVILGTLGSFDTRSTNPAPETYYMGLTSEFKQNTTNGLNDGGTFNSVLSLRQWSSGTDWSGGGVHQVSFTQNGNLWHRYSETTGSWGPWRRVLTTGTSTSRADIIYVRGTGLNNSANRIVRIGGVEHVNSSSRGLTLTIINKFTHAVVSSTNYDTYGSAAASDNLATALNSINNGQIGIITSFDAWEDQVTANLKNAFQRLGLYKALMTSTGARRPYAAVFEASSNAGVPSVSAAEIEHSADGNQPYAELRGWLIDGAFVVTNQVPSGLSTPTGAFAVAVNESGNVGIGTRSPATRLSVTGDGSGVANIGGGFCGGNYTGISLNGQIGSCGVYNILSSTSDQNLYLNRPSGYAMYFRENNGNQMVITSGGNVGINASAPNVLLAVGGNGANTYATSAWIENNLHVQGNENLNQGGRGRLRVGTAWNYVGLYSDGSSTSASNDLVLGASSGVTRIGPSAGSGQNLRWSNSFLRDDQGGSIELGGANIGGGGGTGTPYIDWHVNDGYTRDYDVRMIGSWDQYGPILRMYSHYGATNYLYFDLDWIGAYDCWADVSAWRYWANASDWLYYDRYNDLDLIDNIRPIRTIESKTNEAVVANDPSTVPSFLIKRTHDNENAYRYDINRVSWFSIGAIRQLRKETKSKDEDLEKRVERLETLLADLTGKELKKIPYVGKENIYAGLSNVVVIDSRISKDDKIVVSFLGDFVPAYNIKDVRNGSFEIVFSEPLKADVAITYTAE